MMWFQVKFVMIVRDPVRISWAGKGRPASCLCACGAVW